MTGPAWFKDQYQTPSYAVLRAELDEAKAEIARLRRQLASTGIAHEPEAFKHERDGHPTFRAELSRVTALADSCYERSRHEVHRPTVLGSEADETV